jgi:multiple antibiotic resistance protein
MDINFLIQAIVAMLVITTPFSPDKIILFNNIIDREGLSRTGSALKVAAITFGILAGSALVGRELLQLLGIDQNAFSVVGGIVIAGMGFEMLYQGAPSKAQGGKVDQEEGQEEGGLIIPLSIPLIAGPGAIATTITIATAQASIYTMLAAVIGAVLVGVLAFVSYEWVGGGMTRLSDTATMLLTRIGGLLLATIGFQMLLGGLKNFFS